ncbi:DUF397 domain-containing protein [Streptomyces sp. BHT-5-2]|uniref:DUF397 domain-containing protein n=1 Tax=unclassified Streptomyces TaxID=2593676 RepID=UPI001C8EA7DD|nr:DUF397 domain-containing protein [Streptomyces sp. BHT-5-2]QZL03458.1 DUF397 domain-containing protein [Streptomyces sp. BHT-5-2]
MSTELVWRKSSYSGSAGGECVEIATSPTTARVLIRDSKDKPGPRLTLAPAAWAAFVRYAASGPVRP